MNRRDAIGTLSVGGASLLASSKTFADALTPGLDDGFAQAVAGTAPVKIRDIKTILTAPNRTRLVIVKVETSEPGLVGWGCATFTQRALVVQTALEQYLKPFLVGRNVDEIEDIWQSSYVSSYWRNGPVLFNAMSGVDIALWDIKAKRAGMPLYQLLGGKVRHGADCYFHASGASLTEVEDSARRAMEQGFRHVRVQISTPGYAGYGARATTPSTAGANEVVGPTNPKAIWESASYVRLVPKLFEHLRTKLGDEVELLHDVHERVRLNEAVNLCKALEPYRPYFIEDPFPPEENDHFRLLRQQTCVPIAMGELFNTQHEYVPAHQGSAHRLHPDPHLPDRGPEPRQKSGGARGILWCENSLARSGRRVPHRPRRTACAGAFDLQLRCPRGQRLPAGDQGRVRGMPRSEERLYARPGEAWTRNRGRRKGRRQIPGDRRAAEFRLLLGHDAPAGRHGDSALMDDG